eukprot:2118453-Pleurochrysis_carterae.AAC.1
MLAGRRIGVQPNPGACTREPVRVRARQRVGTSVRAWSWACKRVDVWLGALLACGPVILWDLTSKRVGKRQ